MRACGQLESSDWIHRALVILHGRLMLLRWRALRDRSLFDVVRLVLKRHDQVLCSLTTGCVPASDMLAVGKFPAVGISTVDGEDNVQPPSEPLPCHWMVFTPGNQIHFCEGPRIYLYLFFGVVVDGVVVV